MTPTLIVPGPAEDWLPLPPTGQCRCTGQCHGGHTWSLGAPPLREWVPVTALPEVIEHHAGHRRAVPELGIKQSVIESPRPLRAGDTVELATVEQAIGSESGRTWQREHPFATAVVAEVLPIHGVGDARHDDKPSVEIRDEGTIHYYSQWWCDTGWDQVEEAGCTDGEIIDLPDARPGGWAVRLTNVKALAHVDSAVTPEEAQALRVESINERHARLRGGS